MTALIFIQAIVVGLYLGNIWADHLKARARDRK
jgi:hypothetical protein